MINKIKSEFVKSPNVQLDKIENKTVSINNKEILHELFQDKKLVSTLKKLSLV